MYDNYAPFPFVTFLLFSQYTILYYLHEFCVKKGIRTCQKFSNYASSLKVIYLYLFVQIETQGFVLVLQDYRITIADCWVYIASRIHLHYLPILVKVTVFFVSMIPSDATHMRGIASAQPFTCWIFFVEKCICFCNLYSFPTRGWCRWLLSFLIDSKDSHCIG